MGQVYGKFSLGLHQTLLVFSFLPKVKEIYPPNKRGKSNNLLIKLWVQQFHNKLR